MKKPQPQISKTVPCGCEVRIHELEDQFLADGTLWIPATLDPADALPGQKRRAQNLDGTWHDETCGSLGEAQA